MPAPERIGRYLILDELGQGAMGTVYRARDESLDREVAVKVMSRGLAEAEGRARFQKEARAAARLQHPNIVVVYELGEHQGAPYMVLELLEGTDLQRAIETGIKPDPRFTLPIVLQLLAGLGQAHEHGIVHRDVKPSNVFLPLARPAKIMDFGVARLAGGGGTTTAGTVVGTPNYMSPEQAGGGEVDGRSDLFSTGLILYELVTGEKAIKADTIVAVMYKILHETPDLSQLPDGEQWARLRSVLARSLERRPEDRYPDARAMAADLSQALVDLGGSLDPTAPADQILLVRPKLSGPRKGPGDPGSAPGSPAPRPPAAAPARRETQPGTIPAASGRPLLLAAVAAMAVGLALGGWLLLRRRAEPVPAPGPSPAATTAESAEATASGDPTTRPPGPTRPTATAATAATPAAGVEPPAPTATPATTTGGAPATPAAGLGVEARLARAQDLISRGRWPEALAEARAVLDAQPKNAEAAGLAQRAEEEVVIDECLKSARAALAAGDRERALEELRRGSLIRKNDPRLLEAFRAAVQQ